MTAKGRCRHLYEAFPHKSTSPQPLPHLPEDLDASVLEASLQPLHDLREREKERVVLERQVSAMEDDQTQFAEKVQKLVKRVGALATASPLADYDALMAMSEAAVGAEEQARDAVIF